MTGLDFVTAAAFVAVLALGALLPFAVAAGRRDGIVRTGNDGENDQ